MNFPTNPISGNTYTFNGRTWVWNGTGWAMKPDSITDIAGNLNIVGSVTAPTFIGALIGNASTATKLSSVRTFALTGDITGTTTSDLTSGFSISTTIAPNSVALGINTIGNYAASVGVSGNGLTITGTAGEGTTFTVNSNATSLNTASTLVFRDASGNFSAGTITATTANFTNLTTNYLPKQTASGLANSIIYDNGTNVGISTTTPSKPLTIQNDSSTIRLQSATDPSGYFTDITGRYDSANPFDISINNYGVVMAVGTPSGYSGASISYMNGYYGSALLGRDKFGVFVDPNGNVGINTTTPTTELEVAGTINSSALYVYTEITANDYIQSNGAIYAYSEIQSPKYKLGNGWDIRAVSDKLQFFQNNIQKAELNSDGFYSTGEVTAFSSGTSTQPAIFENGLYVGNYPNYYTHLYQGGIYSSNDFFQFQVENPNIGEVFNLELDEYGSYLSLSNQVVGIIAGRTTIYSDSNGGSVSTNKININDVYVKKYSFETSGNYLYIKNATGINVARVD